MSRLQTLTDFTEQLNKDFIGFEPFFKTFFEGSINSSSGYPPYDIVRLGEDKYELTLAVAGFDPSEIKIELDKGVLKIKSEVSESQNQKNYLHKGIASRSFKREFKLVEYIEVVSANYKNGLLTIQLERKVPENMKARSIDINIV